MSERSDAIASVFGIYVENLLGFGVQVDKDLQDEFWKLHASHKLKACEQILRTLEKTTRDAVAARRKP